MSLSTPWEKVDRGRYATEYNGSVLQVVRRDRPHEPDERPYVAIVDRVPVSDAWNLQLAKTAAIKHVERQHTRAKAERVFSNGAGLDDGPPDSVKPVSPPIIPDLVEPETAALVEVKEPEPPPDTALDVVMTQLGVPLRVAITGKLTDTGNLLDTLNALRSALELLREHAELECTVNLPPTLRL